MRTGNSGPSPALRIGLTIVLAVVVVGLLYLRLDRGLTSADRAVGIVLEQRGQAVFLTDVLEAMPAERAGLKARDRLVAINSYRLDSLIAYDVAAREFESGEAQLFTLERAGETLELAVVPGIPFDWSTYLFSAAASLLHLAIGLLILLQPAVELRSRLLWVLLVAIAIELALPTGLIGQPWVILAVDCAFWLLTGLQFGIELHLVSMIPAPQRWFRERRWPLAVFYGTGGALALLMCASLVPGADETSLLGWLWSPAGEYLVTGWFLVWALGVVALLANGALRWPEPKGRQQAWLVLLGVLPWSLLTLAIGYWDLAGVAYPDWLNQVEPLVFLFFPLAIFLAIYRYRLFDLELVVRRSLVFGALSTCLLLAFYGALGAGGAILSRLVEGSVSSTVVIAAATLVLGLLFSPLRRFIENRIERYVFPERTALRERLTRMVRDLPGAGQLPAMAGTLVSDVVEVFGVEGAALFLSDRNSELLVARAAEKMEGMSEGFLVPKSDPLIELLVQRDSATPAPLWPQAEFFAGRLRSMGAELAVPIGREETLTGVLVLRAKKDGSRFRAEEIELLDLLAHHVATVLENAHLFESATFDGLTGLLRREAIESELARELERAQRYSRPLTVAMIDIDRFKRVNDDYGHLAGDLLLRRVASVIERNVRSTDILGRFGGEEFLLLLPESDTEAARSVVEKLRLAVEGLEVEIDGGDELGVTVSIGLASLDDLPESMDSTPESLLEVADRSLYHAKRAGRNRVSIGVTRWAMR